MGGTSSSMGNSSASFQQPCLLTMTSVRLGEGKKIKQQEKTKFNTMSCKHHNQQSPPHGHSIRDMSKLPVQPITQPLPLITMQCSVGCALQHLVANVLKEWVKFGSQQLA
jgi:hypothetical protein